jgi:hypothetical protein
MAAELVTPLDPETRIPLSIAPPLQDLPRDCPDIANEHHLYHPACSPELQSIGGIALRNSRIQLLPPSKHNDGPHNYHNIFKGPPLPAADDEEEQFRLCVLSCAGYLPPNVLDISGDEPVNRPMTARERYFFRRPARAVPARLKDVERYRTNHPVPETLSLSDEAILQLLNVRYTKQATLSSNHIRYSYDPIQMFFKDFALRRPLTHIGSEIDEFLLTKDDTRRRYLGHWLLAKQSEVATEKIQNEYKAVLQAGLLHPLMPKWSRSLVIHKLGDAVRRETMFPELAEVLRAA